MTLSARYKTRVTIQSPTVAADAVGQRVPSWVTVAARWGELIQRQGRESEGAAIITVTTWELRIRCESAFAAMNPEWRITTASQTFDVTSVINQNSGNRELLINLVEVV